MSDQIEEELPVGDQPEQPAEPAPPAWSAEDVEEARTFGWKAPDEWVGDKPAGYIGDPKAYLERLNNMKPFRTIKEQQARERVEFDERIRRIEAMNAMQARQTREAYDRELESIRKAQRAAVDLADAEQYDALEARKQAMQPPVVPPMQPAPDPYVAEYMEKQDWVKNPILRKAGAELIDAAQMNTRPVREQLEYAEREIRKMYPGYFPAAEPAAQRQPMTQRVDAGGLGFAAKAGEFSKLPPEAKAAFARDAEAGLFSNDDKGRKTYADLYNAL